MSDLIQQKAKNWVPMSRERLQETFSRAVDRKAHVGVRFGALVEMWTELAMMQAVQTAQQLRAASNMTTALRIRQAMDVKNRPKMDDGAALKKGAENKNSKRTPIVTESETPVNA